MTRVMPSRIVPLYVSDALMQTPGVHRCMSRRALGIPSIRGTFLHAVESYTPPVVVRPDCLATDVRLFSRWLDVSWGLTVMPSTS